MLCSSEYIVSRLDHARRTSKNRSEGHNSGNESPSRQLSICRLASSIAAHVKILQQLSEGRSEENQWCVPISQTCTAVAVVAVQSRIRCLTTLAHSADVETCSRSYRLHPRQICCGETSLCRLGAEKVCASILRTGVNAADGVSSPYSFTKFAGRPKIVLDSSDDRKRSPDVGAFVLLCHGLARFRRCRDRRRRVERVGIALDARARYATRSHS